MIKVIGNYTGVVIKYDVEKGYGFIKVDKPKDKNTKFIASEAFVYYKDIVTSNNGFKKLFEGQLVSLVLHYTQKGYVAKEVKVTGSSYDENGDPNGNK